VRWESQTVEAESAARLPGYREAVVRTFDAPEALDTRFYEVQSKSALNHVPKASRMPFRWTINPYRGCSHACVYCVSGDTRILMADGTHRALADIQVGDEIYGTVRRGAYRRFTGTSVLAHWSTVKPAYRVTLADGTELVASGDHRFLSTRGWKHVLGDGYGALQRPHLTIGGELLGVGALAAQPEHDADYRTGYLCGMVRGDALLKTYAYERAGRGVELAHRFRLALADREALDRAQGFLSGFDVPAWERVFPTATANHREITAVGTNAVRGVERVREIIRWPRDPSDSWRRGFLAGIFDAEGSCDGNTIRISNTDREIIDSTTACLDHFGFDEVVEDARLDNGLKCVRLRGGLVERLRFFHHTDPAITRKRKLEGRAIKTNADLRVVAIEPLGKATRLYDITTGTGDFIANGVVSHNCFARPTHTYLDFNAGRDFEKEIVVKVNAPEVLRVELAKPSWKREHVALGTNTDPYQWVEGRYKLMPAIWEALRDFDTPCSVLTKSPLLLRDLELMKQIHERVGFAANLSVPTLDEKAWRATEPHTPNPRARLEAVAEINRAGIPCGILIAPLMPGINDAPEQVERILELAAEAGATDVGGICLHLRGEVRAIFFDWLRSHRPDLVPRYEQLYARGAYAPPAERARIAALIRPRGRIGPRRSRTQAAMGDRDPARDPPAPAEPRRAEPLQTSLF
jgi:DNA repair photolyase